jgi:hypothetical protein
MQTARDVVRRPLPWSVIARMSATTVSCDVHKRELPCHVHVPLRHSGARIKYKRVPGSSQGRTSFRNRPRCEDASTSLPLCPASCPPHMFARCRWFAASTFSAPLPLVCVKSSFPHVLGMLSACGTQQLWTCCLPEVSVNAQMISVVSRRSATLQANGHRTRSTNSLRCCCRGHCAGRRCRGRQAHPDHPLRC